MSNMTSLLYIAIYKYMIIFINWLKDFFITNSACPFSMCSFWLPVACIQPFSLELHDQERQAASPAQWCDLVRFSEFPRCISEELSFHIRWVLKGHNWGGKKRMTILSSPQKVFTSCVSVSYTYRLAESDTSLQIKHSSPASIRSAKNLRINLRYAQAKQNTVEIPFDSII